METKREAISEELFPGIHVQDPYRWLEDTPSAEVVSWLAVQDKIASGALRGPLADSFAEDLAKNFDVTNFSEPMPVCGRYFHTERRPGEDQASLYVRRGLEGEATKLVDLNGLHEGNTVSLDFWAPSRDGTLLAYGLSYGGTEMATLRIKDVASGEDLPDEIARCRYSRIRWLPDSSGFFYTRQPREGEVPENEAHLHTKVFLHTLGAAAADDRLIFGEGRPKDDMVRISLSIDGRYLGVSVSKKWTENDLYIFDRETGETSPLAVGLGAKLSLSFVENLAIVETNYRAKNGRVLAVPIPDLFTPIGDWPEVIPERPHPLNGLTLSRSKIIAEYLVNACSEVAVFDLAGRELSKLPMPPFSSLTGVSANRLEDEFFYGVNSFVFPKVSYRYDPQADRYSEYRRTDNPIDPQKYTVRQEWCVSKDGTSVPFFLFHRQDAAARGPMPTILYGYGGFGNTDTPAFRRTFVPWTERGGAFAVANIRGNADFGEAWHQAGIGPNKQKSFDDFIAVAERLVALGITSSPRLGILGGSNGGLLVCAAATQRPELFRAACAKVPLADMVRFPKFGIAARWVHEYGDPSQEDDLRRILTWSPYHNVREGTAYPATLLMTGENDTRVAPLHALKMAAALQWANSAGETLLYVERDAGHGAGKPIKKILEAQALTLGFFARHLGL